MKEDSSLSRDVREKVIVSLVQGLSHLLVDNEGSQQKDEFRIADDDWPVFQTVTGRLNARVVEQKRKKMVTILSKNELQCLIWFANGQDNDQIAKGLSVSQHTISAYFGSVCFKLEARNRAHAVARAMKVGLIDAGEISWTG